MLQSNRDKKKFNNRGEREKNIIAWFYPEFPYAFGPLDYNSLPGLILELQDNKLIYLVDTIEFYDEVFKIEKPKGKIISEDEYLKKLKGLSPFNN
ncbi:GLPGLI family protein [Flavobacterium jejuense]|uniref:GLPGLI family protein n=1 Tax=Flavobacterium jejuense TaxID=1544455 RepID=A0ABX0IRD5_9FLAO|nr:GLPGLI family protein [Flavobacterium jejuense]NHN26357.1 GLPGLI family protein [Flavobacterium jejuense]